MSGAVIGFAGMTHLGLVSGVAAAAKGFDVVLFDPDGGRIEAIAAARMPVSEPGLDALFEANRPAIRVTADAESLRACDVVFVAPDVPTDDAGGSDLRSVDALLEIVLAATRADAVVVILSQVPPGFTRARQRAGRLVHYQVETLVFGRAVERALEPERFIVGCADPARPLPGAYRAFLEAHGCPILPMRLESAELAKISINMCLVASVSTANTLAELCEHVGADWSEIVPALRLDRRIGMHAYLAPGLGIAGGNLERDLATVCGLADRHGTDAGVVRAWLANSVHRRGWAASTLRRTVLPSRPDALVAVWGLAYKENTHSIKNSPSLATIEALPDVRLRLHDPAVAELELRHPDALRCPGALDAARGADALMILTPWPEYRAIDPAALAASLRGRTVLDPYGVLDRSRAESAGLEVHVLGRFTGASAC